VFLRLELLVEIRQSHSQHVGTLKDDVGTLKENIESTKVRSELGEITKEEAKTEVRRMKDELTRKDVAARELKKIVEKITI
jgi:hypothetical protein